MAKAAVFVIDGTEELEAVAVIDVLRRAGVDVDVVSLAPGQAVVCRSKTVLTADLTFEAFQPAAYDALIIPGGTVAYADHQPFMAALAERAAAGVRVAAICAAPAVLGRLGLLKGKKAVCYPGLEPELVGAEIPSPPPAVLTDGLVTTSRGPSTAVAFGLELASLLVSPEAARTVSQDILLS
ncbi:MAG: DJ-1/PfpI family protein [Deltaproteobacteria bacterium]|jgi:4-methyl-5(b-hydroxyethyl)-thiazole monophosphate biosynthesis|nr:DJ-1/PfpI family protein [Deltaproteobacteria bacterium]